MKRIIAAISALFLCVTTLYASECNRHGQSMAEDGWSSQFHRVCLVDGVGSNRFLSPDGRKVLIADIHGFHLKVDGMPISWPEGRKLLTTDSEVLWSPKSSAFFINDGAGLDGWTLKGLLPI
jgi:hypothetical protein